MSSSSAPGRRQTHHSSSFEESVVKEQQGGGNGGGKRQQKTVFERFTREEVLTSKLTKTTKFANLPPPSHGGGTTTTTTFPPLVDDHHPPSVAAKSKAGLPRYKQYNDSSDCYYYDDGGGYARIQSPPGSGGYQQHPSAVEQERIPSPPRPPPQQQQQAQPAAYVGSHQQSILAGRKPAVTKREIHSTEHYALEDYSLTQNFRGRPERGARVVAVPAKPKTASTKNDGLLRTTGSGSLVSPIVERMPQNEGKQIVKPRLIDFETYKREVEQLQRRALSPKSASHDNNTKEKFTTEEPELISPLSPAIVLASLEDIAHLESPPMEPVQTKQFSSVFNHQRNGFVPPKSADSEDFSLPPPQVYRREVYENIEVFKKEQTTKPRRQQNTASTVDIPITFVVEPTIEGGGGGKAAVQIPVEIVDSSAVQIQHETTRRIFSEKPPPRRYLERYILREEELPEVPIGEIIDDEKPAPEPGEPEFEEEFEEKVSDPDRRLLETLNRELQYEEKVGYEVRKKKRRPEEEGEHSSDGALAIDDEEEENTKGKEEKAAEATLSLSSEGGDEEQTEFEEVEERIQREQIGVGRRSPPRAGTLPPIAEEDPYSIHHLPLSQQQQHDKKVVDSSSSSPPFRSLPLTTREYSIAARYSGGGGGNRPTAIDRLPPMDSIGGTYRSGISSRQEFNHSRPFSPNGHRLIKMVTETSSSGSLSPYPPSSTVATTIREAREREKKEMGELNDRLASYIEKVRFLEAQNRKIASDLDFLRNRWGRDAVSVREMYEGDILEARKLIEDTNRQKDQLMDKIRALEDEIANIKRKFNEAHNSWTVEGEVIDNLLAKLAALESEIALLKRRLTRLEQTVAAKRKENKQLMEELQRARTGLDHETMGRIDYQNQAQALLEEIDFLRRSHNQEVQDLQAMASRDTTGENREFFRNELAAAIRDIRTEYDQLTSTQKTDIESWYKLKVQEVQSQSACVNKEHSYHREELKRLRTQIGDLRGKLGDLESKNSLLERQAEGLNYEIEDDQRSNEVAVTEKDREIRRIKEECQTLMVELQRLLDTKQTLDEEIAIYRRMLEGEDNRGGLRQLVDQAVRTHQQKRAEGVRVPPRDDTSSSSRHSYQRSAKGNVSVKDAPVDGFSVVLENTSRSKEERMDEWKLKRRVDGKHDVVFTFPRDFILKPGKSVTIWARGHGVQKPPEQLLFHDADTFGTGHNIHTILYNVDNEERASLIQRSSHPLTSGLL